VSDLFYSGLARHEPMFMACTMYDLEHMAACIALGSMCQGFTQANFNHRDDGFEASECIIFALMEAAPRSLEALLSFIVMTPYIGDESEKDESLFHRSRENPALTPAQDNDPYIAVMKCFIGLLGILFIGPPLDCSRALFLYMQQRFKKLYPLMIQRLFNLLSRESAGTADGKALGKYARNILARLCMWCYESQDYEFPLALFSYFCECEHIEYRDIHLLYDAEENDNMTEFEQIFQVLTAIVDPDVAIEFYKKFKQQKEEGEVP